jgi:beta-lactamase class A
MKRRRSPLRRYGVPVALLALTATAAFVLIFAPGDSPEIGRYLSNSGSGETPKAAVAGPAEEREAEPRVAPEKEAPVRVPVSEQKEASPEAAAYRVVASEIPGMKPEDIEGVYKSAKDPSWASVRVDCPGAEGTYFLFAKRGDDGMWTVERSIRADEPEYPENENVLLAGVPDDLVKSVYPENLALTGGGEGLLVDPVKPGKLPEVEPAFFSPPEPVTEGVDGDEQKRVDEGLDPIRRAVEGYEKDHGGIAGAYVVDPAGGLGYGVRADEPFFGASVMKVPVMVAVYRKIDEGELALSDSFETEKGDWAAGAGWLQWEEPGEIPHTVEDYLYMMMTQSDNVATNALIRKVGGTEHVNEVAEDLGARNTVLRTKVTSERAIVTGLDNQTTPRDMAMMLSKVATGDAASEISCEDMLYLMYQNVTDRWLEAGLPDDVYAANKTGWLYKVYDDAGVVQEGERPYVVAIFSKHGPEDVEVGKKLIADISESVWKAQSHK